MANRPYTQYMAETVQEAIRDALASMASGLNADGTTWSLNANVLGTVAPGAAPAMVPTNPLQANASQAAAANAAAVATLPAAASQTTYLTGIVISAGSAAAAVTDTITISGIVGGTATLYLSIPAAGQPPVSFAFPSPIAASAQNTAISVTFGATGTMGPAISVMAVGYRQ